MRKWIADIRRNTEGMDRKKRFEYIRTYYWYHILGVCGGVFLAIFLVIHFAFPEPEPVFSCALVNQPIDYQKDAELAEEFARQAGLPKEQVVIDSDYNFSYGSTQYEDVNESSYEKLFLKWSNGKLDAILMTEDFLDYCLTLGGEFRKMQDFDTDGLTVYDKKGVSGILITETRAEKEGGEELVLLFPVEGTHKEECQKFLDFIAEDNKIG